MSERPTLETARLVLRPFHATDAPEVLRMAGDRAVASTTLNIPHPYEPGMAEAWIATHQEGYEEGRLHNFAIERREDHALVGSVGLVIAPAHRRAELGYWIGPEHWRRGYATEAARAVVRHGFETVGLNRIVARHLSRNPASGRVLEKVGFVHEGRQPRHVLKWDVFEDLELYGLLAERAGANLRDAWPPYFASPPSSGASSSCASCSVFAISRTFTAAFCERSHLRRIVP